MQKRVESLNSGSGDQSIDAIKHSLSNEYWYLCGALCQAIVDLDSSNSDIRIDAEAFVFDSSAGPSEALTFPWLCKELNIPLAPLVSLIRSSDKRKMAKLASRALESRTKINAYIKTLKETCDAQRKTQGTDL